MSFFKSIWDRIKLIFIRIVSVTIPVLLGFFILLEISLRIFFPVTDYPFTIYEPETGPHSAPNQKGVYIVGAWAEVRGEYQINSAGWNSWREYETTKKPNTLRIAVIGDSYVEAFQVNTDQSFAYVIEQNLSRQCGMRNAEVYSFGNSGNPLSAYLHVMRYVSNKFKPDIYIILIVHNDFLESFYGAKPPYYLTYRQTAAGFEEVIEQPSFKPSKLRRFLCWFATVRYFYLNLNLKNSRFLFNLFRTYPEPDFEANIDVSQMFNNPVRELTKHIFSEYKSLAQKSNSKLLLIMDTNRSAIYNGINPRTTKSFQYNQIVFELAQELKIDFLDLTNAFVKDYEQHHLSFNSKNDGHWNVRGHKVAGESVSEWLITHWLK